MNNVILYIASTLDGYIARPDGRIDFLKPYENAGTDYGYADFLAPIDVIIMGSHTYEQALTFGDWPYQDKETIVFTHRELPTHAGVRLWSDSPEALMQSLENKKIWLVGGTQLITSFMNARLIHEVIISTIPIILGRGMPLFNNIDMEIIAKNAIVKQYEDVVQTSYTLSYGHT